jgi:hypothetical protein
MDGATDSKFREYINISWKINKKVGDITYLKIIHMSYFKVNVLN